MEKRDRRLPSPTEDGDRGLRCDHLCNSCKVSRAPLEIGSRRPPKNVFALNQPRRSIEQDEDTLGKVFAGSCVNTMCARARIHAFPMQLLVDRVGADPIRMKLTKHHGEATVVFAAAESARAMPCSECGRFVQEEQFREAAWLHEWVAMPPLEFEPASDPAFPVVATPDPPGFIVEAAAICVDKPARWIGDELAERRHAILQRHEANLVVGASSPR